MMNVFAYFETLTFLHDECILFFCLQAGAISSDSLSESDSRHGSSNLLDALSLSSSAKLEAKLDRTWRNTRNSLNPHTLQVPYIVNTCFKHLETYGTSILSGALGPAYMKFGTHCNEQISLHKNSLTSMLNSLVTTGIRF